MLAPRVFTSQPTTTPSSNCSKCRVGNGLGTRDRPFGHHPESHEEPNQNVPFFPPKEQKLAFFRQMADELNRRLGVHREDVFISLVFVDREDWSFGNGEPW